MGSVDSLRKGWPILGKRVSRIHPVQLESRNAYVDIPNSVIQSYMQGIEDILSSHPSEKAFALKASSLAEEYNRSLEEEIGQWLRISFRKAVEWAKHRYAVRVVIDWEGFRVFLDEFSQNALPLHKKYGYLISCRGLLGAMRRLPNEDLQNGVRGKSEQEIKKIEKTAIAFRDKLSERRQSMRRSYSRKRVSPFTPWVLPDLMLKMDVIRVCVESGAIPSCYREMRRAIEDLSLGIVEDALCYRCGEYPGGFLTPYVQLSREWYFWSRTIHHQLGRFSQIRNEMKKMSRLLSEPLEIEQDELLSRLLNELTYPLLLMATGKNTVDLEVPEEVPTYRVDALQGAMREGLNHALRDMITSETELSQAISQTVSTRCEELGEEIVAPYPLPTFLVYYAKMLTDVDLSTSYSDYSYFVHAYTSTWQMIPFSSVLEFKIYRNELSKFTRIVGSALNAYHKALLLALRS